MYFSIFLLWYEVNFLKMADNFSGLYKEILRVKKQNQKRHQMLVEWWTKINTGKYILTANFFSIKNKERFYILGKDNFDPCFTSGFSSCTRHARQQWSSVLIVLFILIIFYISLDWVLPSLMIPSINGIWLFFCFEHFY